jgi:hypothetical protein
LMVRREAVHDLLSVTSGGGVGYIRLLGGAPDDPGVEQPDPWVQVPTA